ncbi:hypothetical protein AOXY_G11835 [Acipenser oxyrinchus oxyrinchus]|uniref:EF-hand domain-containing protein n=1 Tax=Acipenser oxyrinchus oxyrinchus TaxID=40147 RepID=A0AAD8G6I8_ACIOX|nr:hypothetical protein AOXY_G11835 [Acipenser oxyrinchus oxyrinchus]
MFPTINTASSSNSQKPRSKNNFEIDKGPKYMKSALCWPHIPLNQQKPPLSKTKTAPFEIQNYPWSLILDEKQLIQKYVKKTKTKKYADLDRFSLDTSERHLRRYRQFTGQFGIDGPFDKQQYVVEPYIFSLKQIDNVIATESQNHLCRRRMPILNSLTKRNTDNFLQQSLHIINKKSTKTRPLGYRLSSTCYLPTFPVCYKTEQASSSDSYEDLFNSCSPVKMPDSSVNTPDTGTTDGNIHDSKEDGTETKEDGEDRKEAELKPFKKINSEDETHLPPANSENTPQTAEEPEPLVTISDLIGTSDQYMHDPGRTDSDEDSKRTETNHLNSISRELESSPLPKEVTTDSRPSSCFDGDSLELKGEAIFSRSPADAASSLQPTMPILCPEMNNQIPFEERTDLEMRFRDLVNNNEGCIPFYKLRDTLPCQLSEGQVQFVKEIYNMTCSSSSSTFAEEEYMAIHNLCILMVNHSTTLQNAYNSLNSEKIEEALHRYMGLFCSVDRQQHGCISLLSLQEILRAVLDLDFSSYHESVWRKIIRDLQLNEVHSVSRLQYLAFVPFFLALEKETLDKGTCVPADTA